MSATFIDHKLDLSVRIFTEVAVRRDDQDRGVADLRTKVLDALAIYTVMLELVDDRTLADIERRHMRETISRLLADGAER
ncbi:MAG: hypothetical protein LH650_04590 [Chloroflexi bacterium]|nr:hypothetical protein [Chloroflexota bacterium]